MYMAWMYAVPATFWNREGTVFMVSTRHQLFAEYECWWHPAGPLAIVLPQTSMYFLGPLKDFGTWASIDDFVRGKTPAYIEAVFGTNSHGLGLDMYWRMKIVGMPVRETYAYWILHGTQEPAEWWRCTSATPRGMMSFEPPRPVQARL